MEKAKLSSIREKVKVPYVMCPPSLWTTASSSKKCVFHEDYSNDMFYFNLVSSTYITNFILRLVIQANYKADSRNISCELFTQLNSIESRIQNALEMSTAVSRPCLVTTAFGYRQPRLLGVRNNRFFGVQHTFHFPKLPNSYNSNFYFS
jgi:hypothetical protein